MLLPGFARSLLDRLGLDNSALVFVDGDPVLHEPNGVWIFTVGTGEVTSLADAALMHQQPSGRRTERP